MRCKSSPAYQYKNRILAVKLWTYSKKLTVWFVKPLWKEIDGLAVRATIRGKIEAAGVTGEDIREMVRETADSYFRSAMDGHVEDKIRDIFNQKVTDTVNREIKTVIGSLSGWNGREEIRKALNEEVGRAIRNGFDVSVCVKAKGE